MGSQILNAIGNGLTGYIDGRRMRDKDDAAKKDREWKEEERNRQRESYELAKRLQDDLAGLQSAQAESTKQPPAAQGVTTAPTQTPEAPARTPESAGPRAGVGRGEPKKSGAPSNNSNHKLSYGDLYKRYSVEAAGNPHAAKLMEPMLNQVRAMGMVDHAKSFKGDLSTRKGALDYTRHMAEGAARFGDYMKPEQAMALAEQTKAFESEGYQNALEALHQGNLEGATKSWNGSGKKRGELKNIRPSTFSIGGQKFDTYEADYIDESGNTRTINAMGMLFQGQALKSQVDMQLKARQQDHRETNDDRKHNLNVRKQDHREASDDRKHELDEKKLDHKISGAGKAGGMKPADYTRDASHALKVFEKSIGFEKGAFGVQGGLDKKNQGIYSETARYVGNLVRDGARPLDAAAAGKKIYDRAEALQEAGVRNPVEKALQEMQGSSSGGHSSMWR